jgi:hypothetical protein
LLSIQLLSSALRNFMSSRTTVSACSYFATASRIGQWLKCALTTFSRSWSPRLAFQI